MYKSAQKLKLRRKSSRQKLKFLRFQSPNFKDLRELLYEDLCEIYNQKANLWENLVHADNFVHHCIFRELEGYWLSVDYRFYRAKSLMIELLASRGIRTRRVLKVFVSRSYSSGGER